MEQRLLRDHLGENAADTPDIHRCRVAHGAQQDLGRSVPERDDLMRVLSEWDAERSSWLGGGGGGKWVSWWPQNEISV